MIGAFGVVFGDIGSIHPARAAVAFA